MTYQERLTEILIKEFISTRGSEMDMSPSAKKALKRALSAINALNAEMIGEDEDIDYSKPAPSLRQQDWVIRSNEFRADLRQRFSINPTGKVNP